ncbi:putative quinol monooxygenase [Jongsikchunia kroppenstedtii]|uniref:putative quinol monooxygenase n=1 Tax=Jongsikchunia kroppenstedtii TaxID=1121721 RepID=UPI001FDFC1F6|nr:antibiotic biosynthesis monooxygenase [Jongsikchunia kroppenstedtii]
MLTLHVSPDRVDDVVDFYRRERVLEAAHASAAELLIDPAEPGTIVVTAWWGDAEAYDAWRQSSQRAVFERGLADLVGDVFSADARELTVVHRTRADR